MINKQNTDKGSYDSILREASKKSTKTYSFKKIYPALIVLIITLVLSYLTYKIVDNFVKYDNNSNFEKAISSVISRIDAKYREDIQVLNSLNDLFKVRRNNVPWQVYDLYGSVPAKTKPSILSVIYAPRILKKDCNSFIHLAWSQQWGYSIKPEGERFLYYPSYYIVPFEKYNQWLSGYDFYSNNDIQNSIDEAFNNKTLISSPMLTIRKSDTLSIFIISPLFEIDSLSGSNKLDKDLNGILLLEINARLFINEALKNQVPTDTSIVFDCLFPDNDSKLVNIYSSSNSKLFSSDYENISQTKLFKINNRNFVINFKTIPNFGGSFKNQIPILTLIISFVLSIVLFLFLLSIMTSRARAVDIADRMTRSQRRIVDSSKDIIAVLDFEGNWKSMNNASLEIFGINANDLISSKINDLFLDSIEIEKFNTILKKNFDEWTEHIDLRMKNIDGDLRWISWNFTFSHHDSLIYCIGRDVTLEKKAEEQARLKSKQIQLSEQFTREVSESKSYFMTKLSHQFRNSFTSIIGYLELLTNKLYENEEEHDSFVELAHTDSEELFTYVSDMVEQALGKDESSFQKLKNADLSQLINEAHYQLIEDYPSKKAIIVECDEQVYEIVIASDLSQLLLALEGILYSLSEPDNEPVLHIYAYEDEMANAVEIQVTTEANPYVSEMIELYKKNTNSLVEVIQNDKNDIILQFALASSRIRMLNGTIIIDTLGTNEGIVVQIDLPLNKS
jgi:PAS domain S-box-containing protein